jgi:hypothetical protein
MPKKKLEVKQVSREPLSPAVLSDLQRAQHHVLEKPLAPIDSIILPPVTHLTNPDVLVRSRKPEETTPRSTMVASNDTMVRWLRLRWGIECHTCLSHQWKPTTPSVTHSAWAGDPCDLQCSDMAHWLQHYLVTRPGRVACLDVMLNYLVLTSSSFCMLQQGA